MGFKEGRHFPPPDGEQLRPQRIEMSTAAPESQVAGVGAPVWKAAAMNNII